MGGPEGFVEPEIFILLGLFGMVAFIVWIAVSTWHRRHSIHELVSFQERLLDRLGSGSDLVAFVQTEAGRKLITGPLNSEPPIVAPVARVLSAVHSGIVLIALGAGLLSVG